MTPKEKKFFDSLTQRREKLFKALQDVSVAGIWEYIIGACSDNAHFVYELLQNADDAGATRAEFLLYKDNLIFKHNGTKKFSISDPDNEEEDTKNGMLGDINSITSSGNSNKRFIIGEGNNKQSNKIGKFGIGFKSIFRYTIKPEIFETKFSFCIENIMVPVLLDYDYPGRKEDETIFKIPFGIPENNHLKISSCTVEKAYKEISEKLFVLDYPLLFLSHLKEVKFKIGNTTEIYERKIMDSQEFDNNILVEWLNLTQPDRQVQKLLLFSRKVDGRNYSVGFFLDDKNRLKPVITPVFCYFPTKKETNLNFIIHAPFLLTPNREGIKAGEEHNIKMIDLLAILAADSLIYLRDIGIKKGIRLIDDDILKIVPTNESGFNVSSDEISFKPFFTAIKHKMKSERLLPTRNGYVTAENAYWADASKLTEIFSDEQLGLVVDNPQATWVFTSIGARNAGDKANYIRDLVIDSLDEDALLKGRSYQRWQSKKNIHGIDEKFIEAQPIEWFRTFYEWLSETSHRIEVAKYKPFFWDTHKKAVSAFDKDNNKILFLPNGSDYTTIHPDLFSDKFIAKFLTESIGLEEPSLKDEVYNKILPRYKNNELPDEVESYCFQKIFSYYKKCLSSEFDKYVTDLKSIVFFNASDDTEYYHSPNELYFSNPELIEYFAAVHDAERNPEQKYNNYFDKCSAHFLNVDFYLAWVDETDSELLHKFFKDMGVAEEVRYLREEFGQSEADKLNVDWTLPVPKSSSKRHWYENLIEGSVVLLEAVVNNSDKEKSFLMWRRMVAVNQKLSLKKILYGRCEYRFYTDKVETYTPINVQLLRTFPWLVDKNDEFKRPTEITVEKMSDDYDTTSDSAREVIEFLGISSVQSQLLQQNLNSEQQRLIEIGKRFKEAGFNDDEIDQIIAAKKAAEKLVSSLDDNSQEKSNDKKADNTIDKDNKKNEPTPSSPRKLSAKKIQKSTPQQLTVKSTPATDYFKPALVDYGKKLEKIKKDSDAEEEKIKRLEELQQKILEAEKYSFSWCKALLELELINNNENNSNSKKICISFGRVEFDKDTQRTLILKYPSRYIPQFMEDLENIPLILRTTKSEAKVVIEVVGVRHNTLSVKLKDFSKLKNTNLNDVIEARIEVTDPVFLLEELKNQFEALPFDNDYNLRDNLCKNIEFVFGPPGTGKTTHLAERIISLMSKPDNKKILVMTPTNKAADVLVNKIIDRAENKSYSDWLLRFGTTDDANVEKSGVFHDKTFNFLSKPKNVTITTIARFPYDFFMTDDKRIFLREINWDYIIIDEASMIMLAQILLPLYKKTPKYGFIIAGDPFQIEPVTTIDLWKGENIYTLVNLNSFKEPQTVPYKYNITTLNTQYRSVPAIGNVFSKFAYDGILKHYRTASSQRSLNIDDWLEIQTLNIIKFPVSKYESIYRSRRLNGTSSYQVYSALFTLEFIRAMKKRIEEKNPNEKFSIGIISPYRAQADLIEKLFASIKCDVQIGTIHTFQGDECDILIAIFNTPPTISASPEMFLNRLNIINVAISRARDYLFIIMPDDNTDKIENLHLIKGNNGLENLFANESYGEFAAQDIEELIFGEKNYIEEKSFTTGHQNVNVYARPERKYEIRCEDKAVDIQLHEK